MKFSSWRLSGAAMYAAGDLRCYEIEAEGAVVGRDAREKGQCALTYLRAGKNGSDDWRPD